MINTLISASILNNDVSFLEKFKRELLQPQDIAAIEWIINYKKKHGVTPTQERFKDTEHGIYWTNHFIKSPLTDIYNLALETKIDAYISSRWREIEAKVENGENVSLDIINLGNRVSSFKEAGIVDIAKYDRSALYSEDIEQGLMLGFPKIDSDYGGLRRGDFCLITGRPKSYKTLSTNFVAYNAATAHGKIFVDDTSMGKKVLYISGEMTPDEIVIRMDAIAGKFNSKHLRTKEHPERLPDYKKRAENAWKIINERGGSVIIPKLGIIYPETVLEQINIHKPDLVICDAMYRFMGKGDGWRKDAQIVIDISNIARTSDTAIIGTNQLTRDTTLGEIGLSDIAYSNSYATEPSLILAMYSMPDRPNVSIVKILASRNSSSFATDEIEYNFNTMSYEAI